MTIPRAAGARGLVPLATLLVLLLIPAGELVAQCAPGYDPVKDCSAREAHNRGCNQSYQQRLATIGGTYAACVALCTQDDSAARSAARLTPPRRPELARHWHFAGVGHLHA